jgi:ATP-binding cassette subfamily B protein
MRPAGLIARITRDQVRAAPAGFAAVSALTIAVGVSAPAAAFMIRSLLNALVQHPVKVQSVILIAVATMMLYGARTALTPILVYSTQVLELRLQAFLQIALFARISSFVGLARLEDPQFHDGLQLARSGVYAAPQIAMFNQFAIQSAIGIVGFLGPLLSIWWPMAVLLLAATAPAAAAQLLKVRARNEVARSLAPAQRRTLFYETMLADVTAAQEIRLFGLGPLLHRRLVDVLHRVRRESLGVERRATLQEAALSLLGTMVASFGVGLVALSAAHHHVSVGDVSFFIGAVTGVQQGLISLVNSVGMLGRNVYCYGRYVEIVTTEPDLPDGQIPAARLREDVRVRDLWFRYSETGPWILRGVDFTIRAGQTVGLVGENGAGKSTLVKLLCRFYDPVDGAIEWDGVDLRTLAIESYRRRLGVTFQDFMRYELTAQDNIGFGDPALLDDLESIQRAADVAGIHKFLANQVHGYDTVLGRGYTDESGVAHGVNLSGGQWQRVAVARALMRTDGDLLILDEPSSGLDPHAELELSIALTKPGTSHTRLLISHRLATLRAADKIIVLKEGEVAETGTHDELMAIGGVYATMFSAQAQAYQDERVRKAPQAPAAGER